VDESTRRDSLTAAYSLLLPRNVDTVPGFITVSYFVQDKVRGVSFKVDFFLSWAPGPHVGDLAGLAGVGPWTSRGGPTYTSTRGIREVKAGT